MRASDAAMITQLLNIYEYDCSVHFFNYFMVVSFFLKKQTKVFNYSCIAGIRAL